MCAFLDLGSNLPRRPNDHYPDTKILLWSGAFDAPKDKIPLILTASINTRMVHWYVFLHEDTYGYIAKMGVLAEALDIIAGIATDQYPVETRNLVRLRTTIKLRIWVLRNFEHTNSLNATKAQQRVTPTAQPWMLIWTWKDQPTRIENCCLEVQVFLI